MKTGMIPNIDMGMDLKFNEDADRIHDVTKKELPWQ